MQNADIGLAPLVISLVCVVIDGTKRKMRPCRPHFRHTRPGFSGPGQVLGQTFRYASFQVFAHTCTLPMKLEMWANAQRDGRPAEYRWRPLFNATKFG